jgi:uncharacterized hydrophobic protein (TIGR00271 family)
VRAELRRDPVELTSYWLQLVVACGMATLGLVLGSSAVVIGAMLVAPLMSPIVGLGLGFASGSPVLVLRAFLRVLASVVVVAGASGLLVRALPFQEVNAEILARTTPTALDLAAAAFCALAGLYATLRSGSDSSAATTAAGTSIGISLVPPLCVSGFGIGAGLPEIARGAALLFLTNFVAIVLVGTVGFLVVGFDRVDVRALEEDVVPSQSGSLLARVSTRFAAPFRRRWGPFLRVAMPLALAGAVYLPLSRALAEVAWQVRVRGSLQKVLATLPVRVVSSRSVAERGAVEVSLVVLGSPVDAQAARELIERDLLASAGVAPRVDVVGIPDARMLAGLESSLRAPAPKVVAAPPPPPPPTLGEHLEELRPRIASVIAARWPERALGAPLAVELGTLVEPLSVRITHWGAPLELATHEALERALSSDLLLPLRLVTVAVPKVPLGLDARGATSVGELAGLLTVVSVLPTLSVCARAPAPPEPAKVGSKNGAKNGAPAEDAAIVAALDALLAAAPRVERVATPGPRAVWIVEGPCGSTPAAGPDAP